MKLNQAEIRKAKSKLRRLHKEVNSYRIIARDYYGGRIKFGTLQRFAEDKNYVPKDEKLLDTLGLIKERSPYSIMPRWLKREPYVFCRFMMTRHAIKDMFDKTKEAQNAYKANKSKV